MPGDVVLCRQSSKVQLTFKLCRFLLTKMLSTTKRVHGKLENHIAEELLIFIEHHVGQNFSDLGYRYIGNTKPSSRLDFSDGA